jgi:uncharacterized phage protein (TIGR02218 family)
MLPFDGEFAELFAETKKPGGGFCRVWQLILGDQTEILLTDHDRDLTIPGTSGGSPDDSQTFISMAGFSPTAMRASIGGVVDTINAELLTSATLPERKIVRGLFDNTEVRIGVASWTNPGAGVWWHFRGFAGSIEAKDGSIDVEFRKLTDFMTRPHGRAYLGECDVLEFGDARCGLDIVALGYVQTGTVSALTTFPDGGANSRIFEIDVIQADNWFQFGNVEFTSGENIGWSAEIIGHTSNIISLIQKPPYPVAFGNQITVTRGCPRTWTFCEDTVDNLINFRGFGARQGEVLYFMPPDEIIAETPDAK